MLVPTVSAKEVTLAVIADLKPLSYQKGRIWTGKDVEIANEVFKRLNWDVNYIALPFASMLRLISRGDVDGAAGLLCSERRTERYQNIRFSKTTYHTELSIFSLKQPHPAPVFESLESFTEIPIGVTRGYTYGDAFDLHPQIDSVEVENDEDLLNLLVNKRVTFIAAEDQTLLYQARKKIYATASKSCIPWVLILFAWGFQKPS
jgi:ABC-type amino acid transport substrate-binding protein